VSDHQKKTVAMLRQLAGEIENLPKGAAHTIEWEWNRPVEEIATHHPWREFRPGPVVSFYLSYQCRPFK
jgi:hypothetical protein